MQLTKRCFMPNQAILSQKRLSQRLTALLCTLVLAFQSGCSTVSKTPQIPHAPKTQSQNTFGKMAIVTTSQIPVIKFQGFARGKDEGVAKGSKMAFSSCFNTPDPYCYGPDCLLWPVICSVAGVKGGIAGGKQALSIEEVQSAEANASTALAGKNFQETLREQVVAAVQAKGVSLVSVSPESSQHAAQLDDYSSLAAAGVETVLEVALNEISVEGTSDIDPPLTLFMTAHVRLIRTADNTVFHSTSYVYQGEKLKLKEWSANQAEQLLHGLQVGYATLGSYIYEGVFLFYQSSPIKLPDNQPSSDLRP